MGRRTGDATPLVIGHTTDGKSEKSQPEIVGFATNFTVGPLFNTGRQAIFADFHVLKDKVELANQYPRRSVELWPKRWEIDPISLLGATTPERDLGILQLQRQGQVIRYSRISPLDKPRRYSVANEMPTDQGGAEDEGTAKLVAAVLQSAPIQQLMQQSQEILTLLQGGGGEPGQEAPEGQEGHEPPEQAEGAPPEAGEGTEGGSAPEQDERWIHEGAPERYAYEADEPPIHPLNRQNHDPDENTPPGEDDGGVHMCYGRSCKHPVHGGDHEGSALEHPKQYGAFPSSTNDYVPAPTDNSRHKSRKSNYSRADQVHQDYLTSLSKGDKAVRQSRQVSREAQLEARIRELEIDKIKYARGEQLRALQAQGYDLDVAEELQDTLALPEETFNKHLDKVKKRYQRDPSGMSPIRVADRVGAPQVGARPSPTSRMNDEQAKHYARAVGERAMIIRGSNPALSTEQAITQAKTELEAQLSGTSQVA